jgi:glutamate formiminotransferase
MYECVINISEGRDVSKLTKLLEACGTALLDVHSDPYHNRSVFSMSGPDVENAAKQLATVAVEILDINNHIGVHPRMGVVDVVPFVPLFDAAIEDALETRNRFAEWMAAELDVPCFVYGPERALPQIRKDAFNALKPDFGPNKLHKTAGATCVGVRPLLVAYNLWLKVNDLALAERIAEELRSKHVRALGMQTGDAVQVSCNLLAPDVVGPMFLYDAVSQYAPIAKAELVGLVPDSVFRATPYERREELGIDEEKTIEAALTRAGFISAQ